MESQAARILLLEPFYGGSHKQLLDLLSAHLDSSVAFTMPAKKWHWRARTSALYFSHNVPASPTYRVLFCSSVLNLCELVGLRPDMARLKKVLYFHENQLVYPVRKEQDRDFQYGYNQILSCLVADTVVFNSAFNMNSFLSSIASFLKKIPDQRSPKDVAQIIRPKCRVLYFPLHLANVTRLFPKHKLLCGVTGPSHTGDIIATLTDSTLQSGLDQQSSLNRQSGPDRQSGLEQQYGPDHRQDSPGKPLHIVWPHRWEHDKDPELFFSTMVKLKEEGLNFLLSVLGETFTDVPEAFATCRPLLDSHVLHWGFLESREDYVSVLCQADVVLSTARHEFFGVAMLEAVHCGCYPLCPNALVYPEIFPAEYLYATPQQLLKRLRNFCAQPRRARAHVLKVDVSRFSWDVLQAAFQSLLSL
ncbi:glycosyltransferase-like domain-containing protein 1 isoform X2 [Phycodurus eques]|uniref:glycosyltransferase-like domain-containing protein 1 isoform X2 n=1 Tax=Phycodurus eques TaxID=693459 RepID=UPI002ACDF2AC|nr:glycosyltransferase-like domain-containing protein 1 isoform X2 [Phycodurus eques]